MHLQPVDSKMMLWIYNWMLLEYKKKELLSPERGEAPLHLRDPTKLPLRFAVCFKLLERCLHVEHCPHFPTSKKRYCQPQAMANLDKVSQRCAGQVFYPEGVSAWYILLGVVVGADSGI